ncbi:ABC transporter permease [Flexithrix dorotheae]|uniref:ABC transporter permease n=1 Tax=Flexithrix dorotheae TaxID=70993 RepID=UPI0003661045|nr:ABC transporter permease [Flexithrix dorotheae]
MLRYLIKISIRNLLRNKVHAIINILGLALGITCALLIFLVINHEFSYDQFHTHKDRIFRVTTIHEDSYNSGTPFPVTEALKTNFSEIEKISPVIECPGEITINKTDKATGATNIKRFHRDNNILCVEPSFFEIIDWEWVSGSPLQSLKNKNSIVLSEKLAAKFFEGEALGKELTLDKRDVLTVTGIVKDPPQRSSIKALAFVPVALKLKNYEGNGEWNHVTSFYQNFILINKNNRSEKTIAKIEKQLTNSLIENTKDEEAKKWRFELQSINDFHLGDHYYPLFSRKGERKTLYSILCIGIFILLIACINYINLSTALVVKRSREVGIRKVLGSSRQKLIGFFLIETAILVGSAFVVALGLTELALIKINDFIYLEFEGSLLREALKNDHLIYTFIIGVLSIITLLSGLYPSLVLSGYSPVLALKNKFTNNDSGLKLRRALVVFQFLITQVLIIGTLVVMEQLSFFKEKELGFNREAIFTFTQPYGEDFKNDYLKEKIGQMPEVAQISFSSAPPLSGILISDKINLAIDDQIIDKEVVKIFANGDYFQTYDFKVLAGKVYQGNDTTKAVVNETFIRELGIENPNEIIGKTFNYRKKKNIEICGVLADFHHLSFYSKINPVIVMPDQNRQRVFNSKIAFADIEQNIATIEKIFNETYPGKEFRYGFLDENIQMFYRSEERLFRLFNLFAGIAIFIGCLGLYGLVSFMAIQKTKEVGIRKVLGASISGIVLLFSKEFVRLVLIATILAAPIGYFMMKEWLATFNYKIELGPKIFLLSGLMAVVIALITISYQAIKAAVRNPVNSLRSE